MRFPRMMLIIIVILSIVYFLPDSKADNTTDDTKDNEKDIPVIYKILLLFGGIITVGSALAELITLQDKWIRRMLFGVAILCITSFLTVLV